MDMQQKNISKQLFKIRCHIRRREGVIYIKPPKEVIDSYCDILNCKDSYIDIMPICVGNNEKQINLFIPHNKTNKISEVISYVGEIVSK
jgi:hypothetical protein